MIKYTFIETFTISSALHFFFWIWAMLWCHFPSAWKTSFCIFGDFKSARNEFSLSHGASVNICISALYLNDNFAAYRTCAWYTGLLHFIGLYFRTFWRDCAFYRNKVCRNPVLRTSIDTPSNIFSLNVSVLYFGNSHSISHVFIIITFVIVISDVAFIIVLGAMNHTNIRWWT